MSIPKSTTIKCPQCGKPFHATIFDSINTNYDANVAKTILTGERFDATCPRCKFVAHLEYDTLYYDLNHKALIWVIHKDNPEYPKKITEVTHLNMYDKKHIRIVSSMDELREKVACLESEKDDRIVELCKLFLISQLLDQNPRFSVKTVFYTYQHGRDIVFFYDVNGKETHCYLDHELYDFVSQLFKQTLDNMRDLDYLSIDSQWAEREFTNYFSKDNHSDSTNDNNSPIEEDQLIDNLPEKNLSSVSTESDTDLSSVAHDNRPVLFCRKCGGKLLSDSKFCSYCGAEVLH